MNRKRTAIVILACFSLLGTALHAQQPAPESQKKQSKKERSAQKERERREAARDAEHRYAYEAFLEEVSLIITPEELEAFRKLSTNEERERAAEQIWVMRDPTPATVENESRDEHYRRIAYANERFASGLPGWKTDRGRMYIIWGPPDEIESHPAGGPYSRPSWEGGGETTTFPFEQWRYRQMEGVGEDIVLEFVDKSGSGEYRLTMDPSEKDALLHVPGAGPSDCEMIGACSKRDRFISSDGTRLPTPLGGGRPSWMNPFEVMRRHALVQRPPARFKDLAQAVDSRILRDQIQFAYRFDFLRITDASVLVPVTLQIPNREMHYIARHGVHSATLNIYARVSTLTGRTVQVFEDTVQRDIPDSLFRAELAGQSLYQKPLPLSPGLYRLDVVIKDVNSGDVGTLFTRLQVQRFEQDQLASSSLIIADRIEPVPIGTIGLGPFVLGASKVRPRLNQPFANVDTLGLYLQVYNLQLDTDTHKASALIHYRITRGRDLILEHTASNADLGQHGAQLTIEKLFALRPFEPGDYSVEIIVTDLLAQNSLRKSGTFVVR